MAFNSSNSSFIGRRLADVRQAWHYSGICDRYNTKVRLPERVAIGAIRFLDVIGALATPEGRALQRFQLRIVGGEKIVNSKGETFETIWQRRIGAYPLGKTSDPREWTIEPEEEAFAREFSAMSIKELGGVFLDLISGEHPTIESSRHFLKTRVPLIAFIDNLSDSLLELDHHFKSSLGRIAMIKSVEEFLQDGGDKVKHAELLTKVYRYKAFMRELIIRWGS